MEAATSEIAAQPGSASVEPTPAGSLFTRLELQVTTLAAQNVLQGLLS
jgi:hypothetical protein